MTGNIHHTSIRLPWPSENRTSGQLESFKNVVDDSTRKIGGKQNFATPDGYFIPLNIIQGLPFFVTSTH
jgi:hypothetical protein